MPPHCGDSTAAFEKPSAAVRSCRFGIVSDGVRGVLGIEAFQSRRLENLQTPGPGIMTFNRRVSAVDPTQLDLIGFNWCIETDTATPENLFSVGYYPIGTFVGLWDSRNQLNVPRSHRSYNFSDLKVGHHADGTGGANQPMDSATKLIP